MDKLWYAKYWSDRLEETTAKAEELNKKLNNIPFEPLTYEEQFRLHSILEHYASYSRLLADDMAQPDPKPTPFWKKLFKR